MEAGEFGGLADTAFERTVRQTACAGKAGPLNNLSIFSLPLTGRVRLVGRCHAVAWRRRTCPAQPKAMPTCKVAAEVDLHDPPSSELRMDRRVLRPATCAAKQGGKKDVPGDGVDHGQRLSGLNGQMAIKTQFGIHYCTQIGTLPAGELRQSD
jgi:hypothetical protein